MPALPATGWKNDAEFEEWLRGLPQEPEPSPAARAPGPPMYPGHRLIEYTCTDAGCLWPLRRMLWNFVPRDRVEAMLLAHRALHLAGDYGTAASAAHLDGRGKRHLVSPDGGAACGQRSALALREAVLAREVPGGQRCRQRGCRERWSS